jgi:hemerythrin
MAEFIAWSHDLSVGVKDIDEQHKTLVDLVNQLHRAISEHRASEVAIGILEELAAYTQTHFQTEEALMSLLQYDGYRVHKAVHDALIEEVAELKAKLAAGKASVNFELMHFLKQWLTKHIQGDDAQLGAYLVSVGKASPQRTGRFGRLRAAFGFG